MTWRIHVQSAHANLRRAMTEEVGRVVKTEGAPAELASSVALAAVALADHIGIRAGGVEIILMGDRDGITVKMDPWDVKAAGRVYDAAQAVPETPPEAPIIKEEPTPPEPTSAPAFEPLPEIAP